MEQVKEVSAKIKYFTLSEIWCSKYELSWECKALPFDRDLVGDKKSETYLTQNTIVNNIESTMTAK